MNDTVKTRAVSLAASTAALGLAVFAALTFTIALRVEPLEPRRRDRHQRGPAAADGYDAARQGDHRRLRAARSAATGTGDCERRSFADPMARRSGCSGHRRATELGGATARPRALLPDARKDAGRRRRGRARLPRRRVRRACVQRDKRNAVWLGVRRRSAAHRGGSPHGACDPRRPTGGGQIPHAGSVQSELSPGWAAHRNLAPFRLQVAGERAYEQE